MCHGLDLLQENATFRCSVSVRGKASWPEQATSLVFRERIGEQDQECFKEPELCGANNVQMGECEIPGSLRTSGQRHWRPYLCTTHNHSLTDPGAADTQVPLPWKNSDEAGEKAAARSRDTQGGGDRWGKYKNHDYICLGLYGNTIPASPQHTHNVPKYFSDIGHFTQIYIYIFLNFRGRQRERENHWSIAS